jgi:elongation factor Ts
MAAISAKLVMELRESTNLPMMKCKEALEKSNGDKAAAIEFLRKQGLAAVGKFAGRETPNGFVGMAIKDGAGVLVLLGCQTDFVAISDDFKAAANKIAQVALDTGVETVEALKVKTVDGISVDDVVTELVNKIRENIVLVQVARLTGTAVVGYSHGGRIATLVAGTNNADNKLKQVALHVASSPIVPVSLSRDQVDPAVVAKEREILSGMADVLAKPEAMRPKIVDGKLGRFYKENVLLEQEMLLDADKGETVEKYAQRVGITLTGFVRITV